MPWGDWAKGTRRRAQWRQLAFPSPSRPYPPSCDFRHRSFPKDHCHRLSRCSPKATNNPLYFIPQLGSKRSFGRQSNLSRRGTSSSIRKRESNRRGSESLADSMRPSLTWNIKVLSSEGEAVFLGPDLNTELHWRGLGGGSGRCGSSCGRSGWSWSGHRVVLFLLLHKHLLLLEREWGRVGARRLAVLRCPASGGRGLG